MTRARIEGFSIHNSDPAVFAIAPITMRLDCSLSAQSYEPSISSTEQATLKDCNISGNSTSRTAAIAYFRSDLSFA